MRRSCQLGNTQEEKTANEKMRESFQLGNTHEEKAANEKGLKI
jgi:hypothetical protein